MTVLNVNWGVSLKGGVGCIMKGWGWGGVHYEGVGGVGCVMEEGSVMEGWFGVCHEGVGWGCHAGVGCVWCVMKGWGGVGCVMKGWGGVGLQGWGWVMKRLVGS